LQLTPNIDSIDGIKINIYNGDHLPPRIHAIYNEFEALLEIETKQIYAGYLPAKQLKKTTTWLLQYEEQSLKIFYDLNPQLR